MINNAFKYLVHTINCMVSSLAPKLFVVLMLYWVCLAILIASILGSSLSLVVDFDKEPLSYHDVIVIHVYHNVNSISLPSRLRPVHTMYIYHIIMRLLADQTGHTCRTIPRKL